MLRRWLVVAFFALGCPVTAANAWFIQDFHAGSDRQAPAAAATGRIAFEKGSTFAIGSWRINQPADDNDFYVWTNDGKVAIEVIGDSNGWFRVLRAGKSQVVYSTGSTGDNQNFYERPWEKNAAVRGELARDGFSVSGKNGTTTVAVGDDATVTITLIDKGKILLSNNNDGVRFVSHYDESFKF